MKEIENKCVFCENNRFAYHKKIGLRYDNAIIYEDENLYITPDISPVVLGHYLIITKKHIHGYANASEEILESLEKAIVFLKKEVYKNTTITMFEHGAIKDGTAGASIDHAHLHVVPGTYSKLFELVDHEGLHVKKILYTEAALKMLADKSPYLWVTSNGQSWLYIVDKLPSQFLRNLFMSMVTTSYDYNWREQYDNKESIEMYKRTLNMYYNSKKE